MNTKKSVIIRALIPFALLALSVAIDFIAFNLGVLLLPAEHKGTFYIQPSSTKTVSNDDTLITECVLKPGHYIHKLNVNVPHNDIT